MTHAVTYAVTPYAYRVNVWRNTPTGADLVESYTAGNHRSDSQVYVKPRTANAVPVPTLRKYARQTAGEMATAHGLDPREVGYDKDDEDELREEYGPREID